MMQWPVGWWDTLVSTAFCLAFRMRTWVLPGGWLLVGGDRSLEGAGSVCGASKEQGASSMLWQGGGATLCNP